MKDEIKEILYETRDLVLYYAKDDEDYKRSVALFNVGKIEKILDYITNLQQELEEYKDTETHSKRFLYKANKDRLNANLELVKENERLKDSIETMTFTVKVKQEAIDSLIKKIDKAIEYIENNSLYETIYDYNIDDEQELQYVSDETASNNLLNILRGKSDDNE